MILKEAKRLFDAGWAIHWIKPNSKAPVKAGWSSDTRDDWETLTREYRKGYGLGVKMGKASRVGDGYLANIDIDVKSSDPRHQLEALREFKKLFSELETKRFPVVETGYGTRIFVKTKEPLASRKLLQSKETCKVLLPTTDINAKQRELLSDEELKAGWRIRPAWEIELMSKGRQVVLPPSIHPETKKPYKWTVPFRGNSDLSFIKEKPTEKKSTGSELAGSWKDFKPVNVDLRDSRLSNRIVRMIVSGEGVTDRSAACFTVALAMVKAGMSDTEIASVLTDRRYPLGETAYDHRKTASRANAAAWVRDYCIRKARSELSAQNAFAEEVIVSPALDAAAAKEQTIELTKLTNWELKLTRSGKDGMGPPKGTLDNVVLILENAVSPQLFRRDLFAIRDFYGVDAPWIDGKKGKMVGDDDAVHIRLWLSRTFRFEPSKDIVFDAITCIATQNGFHPVRDELLGLPQWDGVERLDFWLKRNFGAVGEAEYLAQVFRKWMVASVTRIFEPGTKFDWMPIFQGAQGVGKSLFGSILFGQAYFNDWLPDLADKDAALGLQGIRCQEFSELESLRKNEVETIKAFITRQVDKVRPPYGRKWIESQRQCVFFGTTNRDTYLKDDTGNRRFCPIEVGRLDFDALARDRDKLWAEAVFIYQNSLEASLYLEGKAEIYANKIREEKLVLDEADSMVEDLREFVERERTKPREERFDFSKFKVVSLFKSMGPLHRWKEDSRNIQYASKALKILGGKNVRSNTERWWNLDL